GRPPRGRRTRGRPPAALLRRGRPRLAPARLLPAERLLLGPAVRDGLWPDTERRREQLVEEVELVPVLDRAYYGRERPQARRAGAAQGRGHALAARERRPDAGAARRRPPYRLLDRIRARSLSLKPGGPAPRSRPSSGPKARTEPSAP